MSEEVETPSIMQPAKSEDKLEIEKEEKERLEKDNNEEEEEADDSNEDAEDKKFKMKNPASIVGYIRSKSKERAKSRDRLKVRRKS